MSTGPRRKDWQEAAWTVAPKLMIAAIAVVAVVAGALVLGRGNAVPATVLVAVGQENGGSAKADQYNPAAIGVTAGDTVRWEWFGGTHDVASYAETSPGTPEWQSGLLRSAGHFYERQFTAPGVYTYYCSIHALPEEAAPAVIDANITSGKMVGKVVVAAPVTPTSSPSPTPSPSPSPSPTAAPSASPTPTLTPPGASATPTPAASPTPAVTASVTPAPTGVPSATPAPSDTPAPTAAPTETPDPVETATPTPAPTEDPQPTATPVPSATPPEAPSPGPSGQATDTPAPTAPAPTLAPAAGQVTPTPKPAASAQPAALGAEGGPRRFPTTGAVVPSEEEGIAPLFRAITLSLTGLLIAIVMSGFIWIERSQRDQPR